MKHRPRVRETTKQVKGQAAKAWQMVCTCGETGPPHVGVRRLALDDLKDHVEAVAPPEGRRCRDPKAHRTKWWDPCRVCADQIALIPLESLTSEGAA